MSVTICRHIRSNGARCAAVALAGQPLCYQHNRLTAAQRRLAQQDETPTVIHPVSASDRTQRDPLLAEYYRQPFELDLPPLEDRQSIQVALSMVINAMARNRIDLKLATSLLYGLQVASSNARDLPIETPKNAVRDVVMEDGQQLAPDEDPTEDPAEQPDDESAEAMAGGPSTAAFLRLIERLRQATQQHELPPDAEPDSEPAEPDATQPEPDPVEPARNPTGPGPATALASPDDGTCDPPAHERSACSA